MQFYRTAVVIGIVVVLTASIGLADEQTKPITPQDDVIHLFNGKSLDGFYTWMQETKYEDPNQVFRVTNGMLHITGNGMGGILTKEEYHNYHLVLEFRWGLRTWGNRKKATMDSGLLIHSQGDDGGYGGIWMQSIEVQMIEGGCGDFLLVGNRKKNSVPLSLTCETDRDRDGEVIWKQNGKRETFDLENARRINWYGRDPDWKDVIGFRGKQDVESPSGEWNRMDVICDGGHIQVFVNGTKVNEGFDSYPTHGKIQFQTEMAEVFIRRCDLFPLDKSPQPAKPDPK